MQLTNGKLTAVKKFKEGDNDKGHWEMWHLTINGDKFTWFRKEKDPVPVAGMVIAFCEYEEETKGKYTNRTIQKAVKWGENGKPSDPGTGKTAPRQETRPAGVPPKDNPWWFCMSYAKDVVISRTAEPRITLEDAASLILQMADVFYAHIPGAQSKPQEKPPAEGKGEGQGAGKKSRSWPEFARDAKKNMPPEDYQFVCGTYSVKELWEVPTEHQQDALKDVTNYFKAKKAQSQEDPF